MRRFRFLRNPLATEIGGDVEAFLRYLDGPSCIFLDGADSGRTRAFVTLLHGNEPSGARALFLWLKSGRQPAVNTLCIVASVTAALQPPLFSHRMLPGARDLNRCFRPPFHDEQGRLAEEILEVLRLHHPEAVIDMHNTSGSGPAFGVCTHRDRHHDALVALFTERLVVSHLGLGALMEISEHNYPTVTVEVGGRLDEDAHRLAAEGLARYLLAERVLAEEGNEHALELFLDPIRLELNAGIALTYADHAAPDADVTLLPDVERHNFGVVRPEQALGWARGDPRRLFCAQDAGGRCAVSQLVRVDGGRLYPARALKLFMVTNNPDIAQSDCLFYAVAADQAPPGD
ncbi:succinylglutamate desuccinylase/aspartoacylase domain-containing protein [Parahaliea mediterranea]|uniref:succinylglutamate desuccinylase/aspartoacylase domain-containing protein n=1 Tax=Parahaliea mediterranea TaxID=651086 RepID=UPI00321932FC